MNAGSIGLAHMRGEVWPDHWQFPGAFLVNQHARGSLGDVSTGEVSLCRLTQMRGEVWE